MANAKWQAIDMKLSWAVRTDPGLRRSSNEDSYCTRPDLGLYVVADGEVGEQRRVSRQHAEVALAARHLDFVHLLVHEQALGRHDLELYRGWESHRR